MLTIAALVVVLAACASVPSKTISGSGTAGPASAESQSDWSRTLAAAKQEKSVSVLLPPGDVYREVLDAFQAKYGIAAEIRTGAGTPDLVPALTAERRAGQYLWDVAALAPSSMFNGFRPAGALDPLRPALLLPEVVDDSNWLHGFDDGWSDREKAFSYIFVSYKRPIVQVNRQAIPESSLNAVDQLWDSQWRGKIAVQDPRVPSAGSGGLSVWSVTKGDEKLREFLRNQQVTPTQDRRQLLDWLVRGQYPIAIGTDPGERTRFVNQGADVSSIKPLLNDDRSAFLYDHGSGALGLFNRAPHPNAAKVLINWLLSQEGQATYARQTSYNSRRTDVPPVDPEQAVDPSVQYVELTTEETFGTTIRVTQMAKELVK